MRPSEGQVGTEGVAHVENREPDGPKSFATSSPQKGRLVSDAIMPRVAGVRGPAMQAL